MDKQPLILREWQEQGFLIKELEDHALELYQNGQLIAHFNRTGISIENILKGVNTHDRRN